MLLLQSSVAFVPPTATSIIATSSKPLVELQARSREFRENYNYNGVNGGFNPRERDPRERDPRERDPREREFEQRGRGYNKYRDDGVRRTPASRGGRKNNKSRESRGASREVQQALDRIDSLLQNESNYEKLSDVKRRLQNVLLRTSGMNGEVDELAYEELDSILEGTLTRMNKLEVMGLLDMLREEEYQMYLGGPPPPGPPGAYPGGVPPPGPGPYQEFGSRQRGPDRAAGPRNHRDSPDYDYRDNTRDNYRSNDYSRDNHRGRDDTFGRDSSNDRDMYGNARRDTAYSPSDNYRNTRDNTNSYYARDNNYNGNDSDQKTDDTWWSGNPKKDDHHYGYERGTDYDNVYKNNQYSNNRNGNRRNNYNSYENKNSGGSDWWQQGTAYQRDTDTYMGTNTNGEFGKDSSSNSGVGYNSNSQTVNDYTMRNDNYAMSRRGDPPALWNNHMDYSRGSGRKIDWSDPMNLEGRVGMDQQQQQRGPGPYADQQQQRGPNPYGPPPPGPYGPGGDYGPRGDVGFGQGPGNGPYYREEVKNFGDNWYSPGQDHKMDYSESNENVNMYNRDNDFSTFGGRGY